MSITLVIIILTALVSYRALNDRSLFEQLKHSPYAEARSNQFYRFISSGFVHGSLMHLGINMYVLYIFGTYVEGAFVQLFGEGLGRINYVLLYLLAIAVGDIPTYLKHRDNSSFASVGASGAVSAILFVFILFNPWAELLLFFIIPCPAIVAAVLYVVYSTWASKNQNDLIDHDAHLYGAIFGFVFAIALKPALFGQFMTRLTEGFPF
ncbi:MAG: rhomboid family intramembrane serine protease [Bacteroidota bacterium]